MPRLTIGTMGFDLVFTAKLPPDAMEALRREYGEDAAFGLTPNWGNVPALQV